MGANVRTGRAALRLPRSRRAKKAPRITRLLNLSLFVECLIGYSPIFHVARGAGAAHAFVRTLSGVVTLWRGMRRQHGTQRNDMFQPV
jgi:hypothetical protein